MQKYLKAIIALFTFYAVNWVTELLTQLALIFHNPQFITAILTGEYTQEHYRIMHSPEVLGTSYILAAVIVIIFLVNTGVIDKSEMVRTDKIKWVYAIPGIIGLFIFYFAIEFAMTYLFTGVTDIGGSTYNYGIMLSIYLILVCPLVEEGIFRAGVLGNLIKEGMNRWIALAVSAIIFGIVHFSWTKLLPTTIFGFMTGWLYIKSKSIVPSTILHILNNGTALLLTFLTANGIHSSMIDGMSNVIITIICIFTLIIATIGTALYAKKK